MKKYLTQNVPLQWNWRYWRKFSYYVQSILFNRLSSKIKEEMSNDKLHYYFNLKKDIRCIFSNVEYESTIATKLNDVKIML